MKNILVKYKIQLISTGILLSIIASAFTFNFNLRKEDVSTSRVELETASMFEFDEKEENTEADNEIIEEIHTEESTNDSIEEIINKDSSVEQNADIKVENTSNNQKNIEAKKQETSPAQPKQISSNSSTPITGDKYVVKKGDTLFLIAQRANITTNHLKQLNNLSSDVIYENQVLNIKAAVSSPSTQIASRGSDRDEDLYWLSRIIHAEAQGESYQGKVAVGNVIINRVNSGQFPNTIKGVVFDKQHGYTQFSPVIDGTIYNNPGADSIKAATDVLNGARPVGNALYFLNPRKSTNFWIVQNRKYMTTIGLHDFYY